MRPGKRVDTANPTPPRTPRWIGVICAVGLVAAGTGVALIALSSSQAATPVVRAVRPVNAGATDLRDIRANNSPTVVANPTDVANLVVVNRIDTPRFGCAMHVSFDAGTSWAPTTIPFPAGEEDPPRCFAPDAAFGSDGKLYVSFITLRGQGNTPSAAWVVSSGDGGRALSSPARASGPLPLHLRLVADPTVSGRLYLTWLQAEDTGTLSLAGDDNPIVVSRSDDGGRTWAAPIRVSPPTRRRVIAPVPAVGPKGDVYLLYLDLGDDALDYNGGHQGRGGDPYPGRWSMVAARSHDGGSSWTEAVVESALVPADRFVVLFPPAPSLAVDLANGRLYAAFHDARHGDADVWLWSSTDGTSFAPGVRVNDTRTGDATSQYLPRVGVAPSGRVDVVYYDRRADPANVMNEVSLQSSSDGGRSFGSRLRLSDRSFDSGIGFGSERNMADLGSRLGLASSDSRALAVWADTRAGTVASNKQDLGAAVVEFGGSG